MFFLSPLTLFGLVMLALPVLIHLLARRRARRLDFPSLEFLRETPSFKLYPRHVRQPLLLALRALALALLVMGLARPLFNSGSGKSAPLRYILMDTSLSMKAPGRAEAARAQARALVDKLTKGELVAVLAFSAGTELLAPETAEHEKLLAAIERYSPAAGTADYSAALAEVAARARQEPRAEVLVDVISDFQQVELEGPVTEPAGLKVVTHAVGSEVERNAFMVDEALRKKGSAVELSVTEMLTDAGGRGGARRSWTLNVETGERDGAEWRAESNGQITGRVKVLQPDDFDADDERFFAFRRPKEPRVLLIEDGGRADLYLGAALEASSGGEGGVMVDRRADLPGSAEELAPYALVVMTLRGSPREGQLRMLAEYVEAGGTIWFCLGRDLDTGSWNSLAGTKAGRALPFESLERVDNQALRFGAMDRDAHALRLLDDGARAALAAVRVRAGYSVRARKESDAIVSWTDGRAALVSGRLGDGTTLLLATSPEAGSGDLGISPAFPSMAASVLAAAMDMNEPASFTIGEAVRLAAAPETEVRITAPSGRVSQARVGDLVRRPAAHFGEPGIYAVEFGGVKKFLAFNPPIVESERGLAGESDVKRFFAAVNSQAAPAVALQKSLPEAAERQSNLWRYFMAAAFLLLAAELLVATGQRRGAETVE